MATRPSRICIYCGVRSNESPDHTPSKGLFPKPAPSNLITVPCCDYCNKAFSKDEEYFRAVLTYSQHGQAVPEGAWAKVERGLDREESRLFELFLDSLSVTEDNYPKIEINVDHTRVDRILVKTLQGLYFYHFGFRLAEGDWSSPRVGSISSISSLVQRWFADTSFVEIGPPVFAYRFVEVNDPIFSTVWQMVFYHSLSCIFGIKRQVI